MKNSQLRPEKEQNNQQDLGLQCQTPLKDLEFTVIVVTWSFSYKSSVYVQTRFESKVIFFWFEINLRPKLVWIQTKCMSQTPFVPI